MGVSLLLHLALFLMLDRYNIGLSLSAARELATAPMNVQQVEVRPQEAEPQVPPEVVVVPPNDSAALLEEVDVLAKLPKDQELDIKPEVLAPQYALSLTMPAREGEPKAPAPDRSAALEIEADLPEMGRMEASLPPAAVGQITVDPGAVQADDADMRKFTEELLKKGANGKVKDGALDGVASLDDLIGLPANLLVSKKTMLPSDLLFDYNSDTLRESAKVGLLKLGLLMDRNPNLYCWIEGHTDLVGGDDFNLDLSRRRAAAVRNYLVESMRMDGDKILTRGKGKLEPLVRVGSMDEQAANRRVEIRMRKTQPPPEPQRVVPRARPAPPEALTAVAPPEVLPPPPPQVVPGKPKRAVPVKDPAAQGAPPRAAVVTLPVEPLVVPKAQPVAADDAALAVPVEIPRATTVDE
jgi:OOP family OmpA-OmpF porin